LTARQLDDDDEVYRYTNLARRIRGQAVELSSRLYIDTGRRQWVSAVVVVWGEFSSGHVEHENVTYIRGDMLSEWMIRQPVPRERQLVPLTSLHDRALEGRITSPH
jgi:hypothetical protein